MENPCESQEACCSKAEGEMGSSWGNITCQSFRIKRTKTVGTPVNADDGVAHIIFSA